MVSYIFFKLIQNAKKLSNNKYLARYNNTTFIIRTENGTIDSIAYKDEFENKVTITFTNQVENKEIDKKDFVPNIPQDYDIIRD